MKHTKNPTRKALLFSILILFLIVLGYKLYKLVSFPLLLKDTHITIEIGEPFHPEENIKAVLFGDKNSVKEKGKIQTDKLGTYPFTYVYKDKEYLVEVEVVDTTPPVFEVVPLDIDVGMKVSANSAVKNIKDKTKTTVSFKEDYDFKAPGTIEVCVIVRDEGGNTSEKTTKATIVLDKEKPVLKGVEDITIYPQSSFDLKKGIAVTDNRDPNAKLEIDKNNFDSSKPGVYTIEYSARDRSGNTTMKKRIITVKSNENTNSNEQNKEKIVYLTFDDGPSVNTAKILDILDQYHVKATFFVIGGNSSYYPLIKEAHQRGHTIALHSYSHDYGYIYSSVDAYFKDLEKIGNIVKQQIGFVPKYIRFPGGSSNTISKNYSSGIMSILSEEVQKRGYQYYDWNWDSSDAAGNNRPVSSIVASATGGQSNKLNILFHDAGAKSTTVEALPQIIEFYQKRGYRFEGIHDDSYIPHHNINN